MSGVMTCPHCGSGNATTSQVCWVCGGPLRGGPAGPPPQLATNASSARGFQIFGWATLLLGLVFTAVLIGVELALEWPGMLIPFALVVVVAFAALARTAYVQIKKPLVTGPATAPRSGQGTRPETTGGVTGNEVVQGVALGIAIAAAVIAGLLLLGITAMVIFFLICMAMFAGMH